MDKLVEYTPDMVAKALNDIINKMNTSKENEILNVLQEYYDETLPSLENAMSIICVGNPGQKVKSPEDISSLKKQIKYARTPMEKKALEKRLNRVYKERRKDKKENEYE